MSASSRCSKAMFSLSSLRSIARSAASASACELTDTYSPAAIDMAPATNAATPATKMADGDGAAAATPTIRLAVETMPSLAPSTAALSQPMRVMLWRSGCARRRVMIADPLAADGRCDLVPDLHVMCLAFQSNRRHDDADAGDGHRVEQTDQRNARDQSRQPRRDERHAAAEDTRADVIGQRHRRIADARRKQLDQERRKRAVHHGDEDHHVKNESGEHDRIVAVLTQT